MANDRPWLGGPPFRATLSTWIVGAIALLFLLSAVSTSGLSGFLIMLGLIALITAVYTVATGKIGWAKLPSRKIAAAALAVSLVVMFAGGAIAIPRTPPGNELSAAPPTILATTSPQPTATQEANPAMPPASVDVNDEVPGDPDSVTTFNDKPSVVILDSSATQTTALALLETLPVKGKSPKTGYARTEKFGTAWLDVDRNGCDTRNDVLARDLHPAAKEGKCKVLTGVLVSPYSGKTIDFLRGQETSALVQIDHVVSLSNAWQTGAQQLTQAQRVSLANDPMNLFAVDGFSNTQKGAGDTATWLPSNKAFRCTYVAHQVSVKATYGLWVAQAEHDAMVRVLSSCPDQMAFTSSFASPPVSAAPQVPTVPVPLVGAPPAAPPPPVAPAPPAPPPAPAPAPPSVNVVHPGSYCSSAGATGVTKTGKPMVCKTTSTDSRLRWRAA